MSYIIYEKKGHIAYITLDRPERLNALGSELSQQLQEAEFDFAQDDDVWVAIYTGAGDRAFSAGFDLKEGAERGREGQRRQPGRGPGPIELVKPTIAAVNGIAYGGGFELAQRCDIRICSENAMFAMPEVKRGLTPVPGLFTLPRLIGQSNAMFLLLTGEPIDAEEAYRLGVVAKVVPLDELIPTATSMAETICGNSPLGVRAARQVVKLGTEVPMDYARRLAASLIDSVWGSEDAREGMTAFVQKRKPVWKMR
jgi:enoyl-CoA hydratase/carnithine racemase